MLQRFFEELRTIHRPIDGLSIDDDMETLNLFAEVLQDLRPYGFRASEYNGGATLLLGFETHLAAHFQQAFGDMFMAFTNFKSDVEKASLLLQVSFRIIVRCSNLYI